jgi:alginate O-acetyltransferase complex protein AlgI
MPQLSPVFLAFCAVAVVVYWRIPAGTRSLFLAIISGIFFACLDLVSFLLLSTLTAIVFYSSRKMSTGKGLVLAGLVVLFCAVRITQVMHRADDITRFLIMIGFGFYILKLIHYRIDYAAGAFRLHTLLDFYNYMLFFPTVAIGPLHRFEDFLQSERRSRWDEQMFAGGLERILYGYAKIVVLANWLIGVQIAAITTDLPKSGLSVLVDSLVYAFHVYFVFSGYSDIAIGLSALFGYEICENFNHPFLKRNIGEFWQSWHMSLTAWCRQYIFLPLFSRWRSLPIAALATMVSIGLWHEFSVRYLLWGIYHAIGILTWRLYRRWLSPRLPVVQNKFWNVAGTAFSVGLTFIFVIISFTIPRSPSFNDMVNNFHLLFGD